jgi:Tfp pilus assembly protein PilX
VKTHRRTRHSRNRGSTLIVTMLVALLLGFTLASYLMLVSSGHAAAVRSQAWNHSLILAEAGVEEALAQLNYQLNPAGSPADVTGGNGWSLYDGFYQPDPPERSLSGGRYAAVYTPDNPPTIYSTGYTTFPSGSATLSRTA